MKFYEWNTVVYRQLVKDESGGMWVIAYDGAAAPQYICGENIEELTEIPPPQGLLEEDSISASKRKTVERRKMVISPLTEDRLCIIDQSTRRDRISAVATEHGLSKRTVKRWYYMFLSQGEKGLVPKGGRKTACGSEDEASFRWALNRYYYSARKMSLRDAYDLMLLAQYSSPDGILSDKYPSFNRFRYYYRKHNYVLKASTSREGQTNYARNTRPLYGKATDMVSGIGCYEMDATIADIYLVSAKDRSLCVGRPYIFLATDVATQLIAGVYVGFESGETAVIECLRNAVSDKVEYCAEYGITINSEDWPSRGLPEEIISDKGPEFFGERIKELCGLFGMRAMSLPAYRPELKGTVEKMFDLLQTRYKKLLTRDGVVDDGYAERGAPDYRREARLNLYELTQIAIDIIIYLNAHRVIDGFIRPLKMAQDSVPVIASYMWRWYKQQGLANLTIIETQEQMLALLPREVGTFTRHGLEFRKLFYRNVNFDDRCARAGLKGKEKAVIAYDTLRTDYVWLFEGGRYYRFDKTSKNDVFSDTSWDEATAYLRRERLDSAKLRKQETQARVLNLFPQVIRHTEYKGQTFYCHQITYISIQCPADCSIKSVCFQIIDEINNLLFSDAPELQYRRNNITTDALVAIIAQLCLTHHIGVIVIDEIQNILGFRKNGANEKLIRFLVQLTNETGICVIMVGTPEVAKVFDSHQHIYRRTRGPRLSAISDMDAFYPLASALWSLQCTQKAEKMTIDTASLLFKITGGIPALLAELLVLSQEEAITSGTERLTSKLISRTAKENNFYDRAASMLKGTLDIIQDAADNCDEISPSGNDRDEHSTDNGKAKRKGRPKIERDAEDIIAAYEESGDVFYFLKQKGMVSN